MMVFWFLQTAFLLCCDMLMVESVFGEKSDLFPKTSCLTITNVETTGQCFMRCLNAFDFHRMLSYSEDHKTCMCCVDVSGNDVIGYQKLTYVLRRCPKRYVTFSYIDDEICLKFVNKKVSCLEAASQCQTNRGDLFKLDTKLKYDILTEYLDFKSLTVYRIMRSIQFSVSVANGDRIEVWIQSQKVVNEWQFHDESPMPMDTDDVCPRFLTHFPHENRIRVIGSTNFECWDQVEFMQIYFLCENNCYFVID